MKYQAEMSNVGWFDCFVLDISQLWPRPVGVAQYPIYQFCGQKKNISYPRLLNSWLAKFIPQPRIIIADMFVMGILAYI